MIKRLLIFSYIFFQKKKKKRNQKTVVGPEKNILANKLYQIESQCLIEGKILAQGCLEVHNVISESTV